MADDPISRTTPDPEAAEAARKALAGSASHTPSHPHSHGGHGDAHGHSHGDADDGGAAGAEVGDAEKQKMEQAYQSMKRQMRVQKMGEGIRRKIMVMSGKGGVGKSTVATGLALSLARAGQKVGILDIDITGPNVPKMLGLDGKQLAVEDGQILPYEGPLGVKVISMAFLLQDPDSPVVWRGPIKLGAIQQFIGDVAWGDLDALIIDFPPGTSDEPLTVAQQLPNIDGMVIVTTPQDVALLDARKSISFGRSVKLPVLGVVENMSGYTLRGQATDAEGAPLANVNVIVNGTQGVAESVTTDADGRWSLELDLFKRGGGEAAALDMGVPYLGRLPFDPGVVRSGDDGVHRIVADPEGDVAVAFDAVVQKLLAGLEAKGQAQAPTII